MPELMAPQEKKSFCFKTMEIDEYELRQPSTEHGHMENNNAITNSQLPRAMDMNVTLWQFLLELLMDANSTHLISWTSNDGEFKLHNSEEVARMWGLRKNKTNMNYDKLSRALRYYYDKNIIKKVNGQKFVYKFVSFPEIIKTETKIPFRVKMERLATSTPSPDKTDEPRQASSPSSRDKSGFQNKRRSPIPNHYLQKQYDEMQRYITNSPPLGNSHSPTIHRTKQTKSMQRYDPATMAEQQATAAVAFWAGLQKAAAAAAVSGYAAGSHIPNFMRQNATSPRRSYSPPCPNASSHNNQNSNNFYDKSYDTLRDFQMAYENKPKSPQRYHSATSPHRNMSYDPPHSDMTTSLYERNRRKRSITEANIDYSEQIRNAELINHNKRAFTEALLSHGNLHQHRLSPPPDKFYSERDGLKSSAFPIMKNYVEEKSSKNYNTTPVIRKSGPASNTTPVIQLKRPSIDSPPQNLSPPAPFSQTEDPLRKYSEAQSNVLPGVQGVNAAIMKMLMKQRIAQESPISPISLDRIKLERGSSSGSFEKSNNLEDETSEPVMKDDLLKVNISNNSDQPLNLCTSPKSRSASPKSQAVSTLKDNISALDKNRSVNTSLKTPTLRASSSPKPGGKKATKSKKLHDKKPSPIDLTKSLRMDEECALGGFSLKSLPGGLQILHDGRSLNTPDGVSRKTPSDNTTHFFPATGANPSPMVIPSITFWSTLSPFPTVEKSDEKKEQKANASDDETSDNTKESKTPQKCPSPNKASIFQFPTFVNGQMTMGGVPVRPIAAALGTPIPVSQVSSVASQLSNISNVVSSPITILSSGEITMTST